MHIAPTNRTVWGCEFDPLPDHAAQPAGAPQARSFADEREDTDLMLTDLMLTDLMLTDLMLTDMCGTKLAEQV